MAQKVRQTRKRGAAGREWDGDHQNQTECVERTETAPVEEMVEQGATDTSDGSEISPGKNSLGKGYLVARYADSIGEGWRRSVEAIMEVARLCVEASERLSPRERQELIDKLPFSETVFSKLIKIGKNERLQAPELQRLLPPHYTLIYSLAGLHKYDLEQAIAARVVRPDMTRVDLDNWINANCPPNASEDTGKDLTTAEVQADHSNRPIPADAANDSLNLGGDADQVSRTAERRLQLTAHADSPLDSKVSSDVAHDVAAEETVSPPTAPVAEEDGSSNQDDLTELIAMWIVLMAKYHETSKDIQEQFKALVSKLIEGLNLELE